MLTWFEIKRSRLNCMQIPENIPELKPMWRCPKCGEMFTTANQRHSCGKFRLDKVFVRSEPHVFRIFQKFEKMVQDCGPVTIIPQKTRVTFQVRMRFVSVYPRRSYLMVGFVFARRLKHPRFFKIETFSPRNHLHHIRISSEAELDSDFLPWIREAYAVGEQKHLR